MKYHSNPITELGFAKINAKYMIDEIMWRHHSKQKRKYNNLKRSVNMIKDTINNTVDMYADTAQPIIGKNIPNIFKAAAKAYKDNRK